MKTVTLPIEEYEELVNAQRAADAKMIQAESMIEKRQVRIFVAESLDEFFGWREVDTSYILSGEDEFPVKGKIKELLDKVSDSQDEAVYHRRKRDALEDEIVRYNKLNPIKRLFTKIDI